MVKKQGVVRRTISLPADVDRRMEKATGINWSEVARLAFEKKLAELAKTKELKGMASIIDRMRKAEEEDSSEMEQIGMDAGRQWAKEYATPKQLRRLEDLAMSGDFDAFLVQRENDAFGPCERLVDVIEGRDCDRQDCNAFWHESYGDSNECDKNRFEEGFTEGFVKGALEIWKEVKDSL